MAPPVTKRDTSLDLSFLWLEITGHCQLRCIHCYAESSPRGTHGILTDDDWRRVIDEAAALGVQMVQFIGGEPTLHPSFSDFVPHALNHGLAVEVFSNLGAPRGALSYPRFSRGELKGGSRA